MADWKVNEVAEYLDISKVAVQNWTDDYSWALSAEAAPGKGRTRHFTPRDVAILVEVDRQSKAGVLHEQIRLALRSMITSGQFDTVEEYPEPRVPDGSIPASEHYRLMLRAEEITSQALRRAERAESDLMTAREKIAKLEGRIEEMQRAGSMEEVIRLNREIARLEYRLELARKDGGEDEA
ncbi:MAG: hypothetical protein IT326_03345 [Anaerolineae bacterium]|nr:hypothetical protein [Anaerolineae bacterium]